MDRRPTLQPHRRSPNSLPHDDPDYSKGLAGLILGEVKLYCAKAIREARSDPSLAERLDPDMQRAYRMYVDRTGKDDKPTEATFRDAVKSVFGEDAPLIESLFQKALLQRAIEKSK